MQISCKSDIGRMRSQNQDSVFASDKPVGKLPNLLIVADGMVFHNGFTRCLQHGNFFSIQHGRYIFCS